MKLCAVTIGAGLAAVFTALWRWFGAKGAQSCPSVGRGRRGGSRFTPSVGGWRRNSSRLAPIVVGVLLLASFTAEIFVWKFGALFALRAEVEG